MGCNVFPHYGKHSHGICDCFWNDVAQSWVIKLPLISESTRLKTNKVCKQFCTSGCFMNWTIIYLGLNLKKFISSPGKGTVPAGGFVSQGVLVWLLQSNSQLPISLCSSQVRVIHSTFACLSNTSVIFRNVYKCQQAAKAHRTLQAAGRCGVHWDYITLKPECWGRGQTLPSQGFLAGLQVAGGDSSGRPDTGQWQEMDRAQWHLSPSSPAVSMWCVQVMGEAKAVQETDRPLLEASASQWKLEWGHTCEVMTTARGWSLSIEALRCYRPGCAPAEVKKPFAYSCRKMERFGLLKESLPKVLAKII